jgi:hypothetical protein
MLLWHCRACGDEAGPFYAALSTIAASLLPEWQALRRAAPRLRFGPEHLVKAAGEERLVVVAVDPDAGREVSLSVDIVRLEARLTTTDRSS